MEEIKDKEKPFITLPTSEPEHVEDLLGRDELVTSVSRVLEGAQFPCTIAITGEWGVGKTTFLRLLEQKLRENGHIPIWFDLWEYEATGNVIYALAQKMLEECGDAADKELKKNFLNAASLIGKSAFSIAGFLSGMLPLASVANQAINVGIQELSPNENVVASTENAYKSVKALKDGFNEAIERIIAKNKETNPGCRIVILIDDIDRCFPENVTGLLTGIKNYLTSDNCAFVLAIDKNRAEAAINSIKHYDKAPGNWLEKLFTFEISLPIPENEYWSKYLSAKILEIARSIDFGSISHLSINVIYEILSSFHPNPRRWNRFISDFTYFCLDVFQEKDKYKDRLSWERSYILVATLLAYKHFVPEIFSAIRENPNLIEVIRTRINQNMMLSSDSDQNLIVNDLVKNCENIKGFRSLTKQLEEFLKHTEDVRIAMEVLSEKGLA